MDENTIKAQFDCIKRQGWLPYFEEAAEKFALPVELLLAIGSRETNLRNIVGDGENGYGVGQIDKRSFPEWVQSGAWRDPRESILKMAEVLRGKFNELRFLCAKTVHITDSKGNAREFVMPSFDAETEKRVAVASYNSGLWAAYHASKLRSPDYGTTGGDYSADVLDRAEIFRRLCSVVPPSGGI